MKLNNDNETRKKLDNETSESVDGSLQSTKFVEIYNKIETKLTKIPYSFFVVVVVVVFKMHQNR